MEKITLSLCLQMYRFIKLWSKWVSYVQQSQPDRFCFCCGVFLFFSFNAQIYSLGLLLILFNFILIIYFIYMSPNIPMYISITFPSFQNLIVVKILQDAFCLKKKKGWMRREGWQILLCICCIFDPLCNCKGKQFCNALTYPVNKELKKKKILRIILTILVLLMHVLTIIYELFIP